MFTNVKKAPSNATGDEEEWVELLAEFKKFFGGYAKADEMAIWNERGSFRRG